MYDSFFREPSYEFDCVTLQNEGSVDNEKWNWVTHRCTETSTLYPICEYPSQDQFNFEMDPNEGNLKLSR